MSSWYVVELSSGVVEVVDEDLYVALLVFSAHVDGMCMHGLYVHVYACTSRLRMPLVVVLASWCSTCIFRFLSWQPRSDLSLQLHAAGMSDTSKPKPAGDAPPPHDAMVLAVRLRLDHPAAASSTSRPAVTPADVHADAKD